MGNLETPGLMADIRSEGSLLENDALNVRLTRWSLVVEKLPAIVGDIRDLGLSPVSARSPGEGHGNPLQYSWLENPVDRGAWLPTSHSITKNQI